MYLAKNMLLLACLALAVPVQADDEIGNEIIPKMFSSEDIQPTAIQEEIGVGISKIDSLANGENYQSELIAKNATSTQTAAIARVLFGGKATNHLYNGYGNCPYDWCNTQKPGYVGGHSGLDIQTTSKGADMFFSVSSGVVVAAGGDAYSTIAIYDPNRNSTMIYLHARSVLVKLGEEIKVGAPLGIQGDKGSAGAFHVHLEARLGRAVRPANGKTQGTLDVVNVATSYLTSYSPTSHQPNSQLNADPREMWRNWQSGSAAITRALQLRDGRASNMSPAEIIYYSALENNINPVTIIAKIQGEQGLVEGSYAGTELVARLELATGYGARVGAKWFGFYPQVVGLSYQFDQFSQKGMDFSTAYQTYTQDIRGPFSQFQTIYAKYAGILNRIAGTNYSTTPNSEGYYRHFMNVNPQHIHALLQQTGGVLSNARLFGGTGQIAEGGTPTSQPQQQPNPALQKVFYVAAAYQPFEYPAGHKVGQNYLLVKGTNIHISDRKSALSALVAVDATKSKKMLGFSVCGAAQEFKQANQKTRRVFVGIVRDKRDNCRWEMHFDNNEIVSGTITQN